jgi:hypothetical protein
MDRDSDDVDWALIESTHAMSNPKRAQLEATKEQGSQRTR